MRRIDRADQCRRNASWVGLPLALLTLSPLMLAAVLSARAEDGPATGPAAAKEADRVLFDGKSLDGWKIADQFDFADHGAVEVKDGLLVLTKGDPATGIVRTDELPKIDYELQLEARRTDGRDFFCGLTFPIRDSFATLIVGGWGGGVIGVSNIDGASAAENSTSTFREFEANRWYKIRLRVTTAELSMWLDDKRVIQHPLGEHKFNVWWEMEPMRPLGIATWHTSAELRNVRLIHPLPVETNTPAATRSEPTGGTPAAGGNAKTE
ncbi:MAG: DUF1080 domain-containing protein [Pirellulales bacterium]